MVAPLSHRAFSLGLSRRAAAQLALEQPASSGGARGLCRWRARGAASLRPPLAARALLSPSLVRLSARRSAASAQRQRYSPPAGGSLGRWAAAPPWPGCQASSRRVGGSAPTPPPGRCAPALRGRGGPPPRAPAAQTTRLPSAAGAPAHPLPPGAPEEAGKHPRKPTAGSCSPSAPSSWAGAAQGACLAGKRCPPAPLASERSGPQVGVSAPGGMSTSSRPEACQGQRQAGRGGAPRAGPQRGALPARLSHGRRPVRPRPRRAPPRPKSPRGSQY